MSNLKLNFVHICDTAFLSENKNLNIIGIFENILTSNFPAIHPRLTIVSNIKGEPGHHKFKVKIVDNSDKDIIPNIDAEFTLDSQEDKFGFIGNIGSIKFEKEGKYKVLIYGDDEIIGELQFSVKKINQIPNP